MGSLLLRGMIVGIIAGLVAFAFARLYGEPAVERAIAFEEMMSAAEDAAGDEAAHADGAAHEHGEEELVSRTTQAGAGLGLGLVVFGAAIGGLFALAFAFASGRLGTLSARATSALIAFCAFVAVALVPQLKYPANPPAVGFDDTIGLRTRLFFVALLVSVVAAVGAVMLARALWARAGGWNAVLAAAAGYGVVMLVVLLSMPAINEMPDGFAPDVIWQFRTASLGIHAIVWAVIGLGFGAWMEHGRRHLGRHA